VERVFAACNTADDNLRRQGIVILPVDGVLNSIWREREREKGREGGWEGGRQADSYTAT